MAWDFAMAAPHSAPGVASMVGYRGLDVPDAVHLGLPSASLTFILSLDEGVEAADTLDALSAARPNPVILGGLHVAASRVRQRPGQAGVQLAVHPLACRALFGVPSAWLDVSDFDGAEFLGPQGARVLDRLSRSRGWDEAFSLVRHHLVRRYRDLEASAPPAALVHAWTLLEQSRGRLPIGALAPQVGVSARHLGSLFHNECGRSPKTVARLMRFEHARARITEGIRKNGRAGFAQVAAQAGFSDQAHLNREFVRFTGLSPGAWSAGEFRNIQDGAHTPGAE
ncbi:Transcriptional regulator, AraC family [Nocardiopsis sp. JB363]|nr:Transcriptional regulator, AraC family [Nocardiopsis sp. JB363]